MCYSPVLMRSNALLNNIGYRTFNFVPCGNCFQCRTQKATSYYVRAAKELQLYNDPHCMVLMVLLTYNEKYLPRVSNDSLDYIGDLSVDPSCPQIIKHKVSKNCPWDDQSGNLCYVDFKPVPCFDISHIDKFFKKLRARFIKHLKYVPIMSYFLVAENGDKRQRPHYHMLLFIDLPKSFFYLCKTLIRDSWSVREKCKIFVPYTDKFGNFRKLKRNGQPYGYYRTTQSVPLGHVFFDEEDGKQFVDPNDPHVSRYLSQYLTTDPYFETLHHENLRQLSPRNQKIYTKKFGTFRLTSHYFGISALWDNSVNVQTAKVVPTVASDHSVDLPNYYYRYVYYTFDENEKKYIRNSNYTHMLDARISERYANLCKSFSRFFDHMKKGQLHPRIYDIYDTYLAQGITTYKTYDHGYVSFGLPSVSELVSLLANEISYTDLVGYYLLLFCVNKYKYDSKSYLPLEDVDYTFSHLSDRDFVFESLRDFYKLQESAHTLGDVESCIISDARFVPYESLCVLFSIWIKFDLVVTNENKFKDWNKKAESLGKTKYLARPHALAL